VSGLEDPRPGEDWAAFRAARERFFATARPEAMDPPPAPICPAAPPVEWTLPSDPNRGDAARANEF
jgi:hypothetical protein